MKLDLEAVGCILEETATEEILPRFQALAENDKRIKPGGEIVTVADEATEKRLAQRLSEILPDSLIVGEEAAAADPKVFDRLLQDRPVWVIDPIDGTSNFAEGIPVFAVMVALVQGGSTRAAWIHEPRQGRTAIAEQGSGAWCSDQRLRVGDPGRLEDMSGTLHASQYGAKSLHARARELQKSLATVPSQRCAGAEYLRLARGETQFTFFSRLMPWDHAPGLLIHAEAGGFSQTAEGTPYSPARRDGQGVLATPDEASWQALHQALFGDRS